MQDLQDGLRKYCEDRLDSQSKSINNTRTDVEVKLIGLETKHNSLAEELWGEETGLARVQGELTNTNKQVHTLVDDVKKLQKTRATTAQLERVQEGVAQFIQQADSNVTQLKSTVGNVVNDVKEHFRTASNTIAAHNATLIQEVRSSYQEELAHSLQLRTDVVKYMSDMDEKTAKLEGTVKQSHGETQTLVKEVRLDVEDLNKKRKRDKANGDVDTKALKKRLEVVCDNSELVLKGMEHLTGVLGVLIESNRIASHLDSQDDKDRRQVGN